MILNKRKALTSLSGGNPGWLFTAGVQFWRLQDLPYKTKKFLEWYHDEKYFTPIHIDSIYLCMGEQAGDYKLYEITCKVNGPWTICLYGNKK